MAELAPDPTSPTGTGPRQDAIRSGVDYRQIQAPTEMLAPWQIPNTGKQEEFEQLAAAFKGVQRAGGEIGNKLAEAYGAQRGAAAGASGKPDYVMGLGRLSAYGQAYNNAATGAFLTESEIQADQAAAKARVVANNDPNAFAKIYGASADAAVKNSPVLAQPALRAMYNDRLAQGVASVAGAQAEEMKQTQSIIYKQGIDRQTSRVAVLQGSANPQDQARAIDEHAKLELQIHGGVNAGLYSQAEAQAMSVNAMRTITGQVFDTQVDREIANMANGDGDAGVVGLLENFRKAHLENLADNTQAPILSETEYQQLYQTAKQKLQQQNLIDAYSRRDGKTAEEMKYEAGDRAVTVAMASGTPGDKLSAMVTSMVASQDLKPEVGRAVLSSINRGHDAPPNARGLFNAENNPARFDWGPTEISAGIDRGEYNSRQAIELTSKIEQQRNSWESHPPIRDAQKTIEAALKLPTGLALQTASDEEKKAAVDAQVEFTKQMNAVPVDKRDGEAPRVANNVVLKIQAQGLLDKAASYERQRSYVDSTYGPGGSSYRSAADYAARKERIDAQTKAARAEAARLQGEIK